jgi:phage antirepressor YoqD-like protein
MNDLTIFKNPKFGEVRTIIIDGKEHFVASDVARNLGYKNTREAIADHCRWVAKCYVPHPQSPEKELEVNCIPIGDVCRLVTHSELPGAPEYESWIYDEVLPVIHKHGGYLTTATMEQIITNPDSALDLVLGLATKLKEEKAGRLVAEQQLQIATPKVEYYDDLIDRNMLTNLRETAILLGVPEREFIRVLKEKEYIYKDGKGKNMPYADKNDGLFEIKEVKNDRTQWAGVQTLVTPKGRKKLWEIFKGRNN